MHRLSVASAAMALAAGLLLAQQPEERKEHRFQPPEVLAAAELYYPPLSAGFGTVVLQGRIDPADTVEDVRVIKDIKSLAPEAVRSVKKWKLKPAGFDGKPVRAAKAVAFTFSNPFGHR